MTKKRFYPGDRVSVAHRQLTGHNLRTAYSYGSIIAPRPGLARCFYDVLLDGSKLPVKVYASHLHLLKEEK